MSGFLGFLKERTTPRFWVFVLLCLVLLVSLPGFFMSGAEKRCAENCAEAFIAALALKDVDGAKARSIGQAAFAAARLEQSPVQPAQAVTARADAALCGRGYAVARVTADVRLADGEWDVGFYKTALVKSGGEWKVASFREDAPPTGGFPRLFGRGAVLRETEAVFSRYLELLASGDYRGAASCLAGPARRGHEAGSDVFGKGRLIGEAGGLRSELLWAGGGAAAVRHSYTVDGREASVVATYYRTQGGWKIVEVVGI